MTGPGGVSVGSAIVGNNTYSGINLAAGRAGSQRDDDADQQRSGALPAVDQRDDGRVFERNGEPDQGQHQCTGGVRAGHELQRHDGHYGHGDGNDDHRVQQRDGHGEPVSDRLRALHRVVQHYYVLLSDLSDGGTYDPESRLADLLHHQLRLGPQAAAVAVAVASSTTTVGTISGSPATFVAGGGWTNSAISFTPVTAGTTNLTLTQPAGYSTPYSGSYSAQQIVATVTP